MKLTPKNLMALPVGQYLIKRSTFEGVERNELRVTIIGGERKYYVGSLLDRFTVLIEIDYTTKYLYFVCIATIGNELFEMSASFLVRFQDYKIIKL